MKSADATRRNIRQFLSRKKRLIITILIGSSALAAQNGFGNMATVDLLGQVRNAGTITIGAAQPATTANAPAAPSGLQFFVTTTR